MEINKEYEYVRSNHYNNPESETSESYQVKLDLFENKEPKELLLFMWDFNNIIDRKFYAWNYYANLVPLEL